MIRLNIIAVLMITSVSFLAVFEHQFSTVNPGKICSKLTIETLEQGVKYVQVFAHWHILVYVRITSTLNHFMPLVHLLYPLKA